jgi:hypothetical protein
VKLLELEFANSIRPQGHGIREGWLRLRIDEVFPLEEALEVYRKLENRESIGKIVLPI